MTSYTLTLLSVPPVTILFPCLVNVRSSIGASCAYESSGLDCAVIPADAILSQSVSVGSRVGVFALLHCIVRMGIPAISYTRTCPSHDATAICSLTGDHANAVIPSVGEGDNG